MAPFQLQLWKMLPVHWYESSDVLSNTLTFRFIDDFVKYWRMNVLFGVLFCSRTSRSFPAFVEYQINVCSRKLRTFFSIYFDESQELRYAVDVSFLFIALATQKYCLLHRVFLSVYSLFDDTWKPKHSVLLLKYRFFFSTTHCQILEFSKHIFQKNVFIHIIYVNRSERKIVNKYKIYPNIDTNPQQNYKIKKKPHQNKTTHSKQLTVKPLWLCGSIKIWAPQHDELLLLLLFLILILTKSVFFLFN